MNGRPLQNKGHWFPQKTPVATATYFPKERPLLWPERHCDRHPGTNRCAELRLWLSPWRHVGGVGGGGGVTTAGHAPSSLSLSACGESQAEPGPSPTRRVKASVLVLRPPFPNAHSGVASLMHVKKPVKSFALCPWPKDKPLETTE